MKKCASCTKDLPEAALHCVFCGAKQPPAPAVQPGLAKTAFGYSNEMMEQLRQPPGRQPAPVMPQRVTSQSQPPPLAVANAATLFIDNGQPQPPPQQPLYAQPTLAAPNPALQATFAAPPQQQIPPPLAPMRSSAPSQPPPYGQMRSNAPSQPPPYGQPQQPAPIFGMPPNGYPSSMPNAQPQYPARGVIISSDEPWRESLKLMMIVWGLLVIAALATPLKLDPLAFSWNVLLHGDGTARIPFLVDAALGVLGVVVALLPMPTVARGTLAAMLGLAVLVVPLALAGEVPDWELLVVLASVVLIVPALLLRSANTSATLPRIVVTLCVIAYVLQYLVPVHGDIPLVGTIRALLDAPGEAKIEPIIHIARLAIVVLTLLVWMPGPATAGGTMFAWLILLAIGLGPTVLDVGRSALDGHVVDAITTTPAVVVVWVIPTACLVFVGYGLAAVVGKRLE